MYHSMAGKCKIAEAGPLTTVFRVFVHWRSVSAIKRQKWVEKSDICDIYLPGLISDPV